MASNQRPKYLASSETSIETQDVVEYKSETDALTGEPWRLGVRWLLVNGVPEPVALTVERRDGAPVTASAVRALPLGDMIAEGRAAVARHASLAPFTGRKDPDRHVPFTGGPRRGRPQTDAELQVVADAYREARRWGRSVQAEVAKACNVSPSTATKRIMKARAAGLIDGGPARS